MEQKALSKSSLGGGCGRFSERMAASLTQLNNSLHIDKRLYAEDFQHNLSYAEILCDTKIIQSTQREFNRKIILRECEKLN